MFHLQSSIHLHEIKTVVGFIQDEFNCTRPHITHRFGGSHRGLSQFMPQFRGETWLKNWLDIKIWIKEQGTAPLLIVDWFDNSIILYYWN